MTKEALELALEALEEAWYHVGTFQPTEKAIDLYNEARTVIKEALAQPEQEPVAHSVIAGALFDFMAWLTSRKERIVLSSADEASPAVDAIRDFAKMRGLSLDDAKVQDWNTTTWVGLTDEEAKKTFEKHNCTISADLAGILARAITAKLKEKNT